MMSCFIECFNLIRVQECPPGEACVAFRPCGWVLTSISITDLSGLHRTRTCVHSPNPSVWPQAVRMGLPSGINHGKRGPWETSIQRGRSHSPSLPLGRVPRQGKPSPGQLLPTFPPPHFSPSLSLFLPPKKRASGSWLPLPGNEQAVTG